MSSNENGGSLPLNQPSAAATFACLVYLSIDESGSSIARVANLENLQATGATPRDALMRVCRDFKSIVRGAYAAGEADTIPWIDPPLEPKPGEQVRSVPVHL
jgi:hypothetical protein